MMHVSDMQPNTNHVFLDLFHYSTRMNNICILIQKSIVLNNELIFIWHCIFLFYLHEMAPGLSIMLNNDKAGPEEGVEQLRLIILKCFIYFTQNSKVTFYSVFRWLRSMC